MKNLFKKIIPLAAMLSILCTVNASAATQDPTFSSSSDPNRKVYTPVHCQISISRTSASFQGMNWSSSYGAAYSWEGELRVANPAGQNYKISDAYTAVTGVAGTLPQLSKDGASDSDDRAFRCNDMSAIKSSESYYVIMSMSTGPKYNNGVTLYFESEQGFYNPIDSIPYKYQAFSGRVVTAKQYDMGW